MAENKLYKIIASIGAVLIYLFFVYTFVQFVKDNKKIVKDFGYNVEDAVVVQLDALDDKKPTINIKKPKPIQKPKPMAEKPKPPVEDAKPKQLSEKTNQDIQEKKEEIKEKARDSRDLEAKSAKDLFSTIRVKKYEKVIEERQKEDAARASRLAKQKAAKEKELKQKKKREKALAVAKALLQDIQTQSASSHKKRGEKDRFWSPVSNRIMAKWNRTISTQDGLMATVKIRIDKNGKLTFRIKRLSNNSLFDTKLKIFLENLEYERFPKYHGGAYIEANFEFKDQSEAF